MTPGYGTVTTLRVRWLALIAVALISPSLVDRAWAGTDPIRTVEHLSFVRESATDKGTKFRLLSVKCKATSRAYIYVCNFGGLKGKQSLCAAIYVHYHPGHMGHYPVNFWGQSWPCGSKPPLLPPAYPGDGGPKS